MTPGRSTLRRSVRVQGQERENYHECVESETRSGSDDDGSDGRPFYGLKLRAADPRYVTHGDILLILAEVRELLIKKQQSGYKGRESQRPISSASNITICYKYSSRSWRWGRKGPAGQGCLAGISTLASTVGQNQQDNGRRQHPSAGLQRCQRVAPIYKNRPKQESPLGKRFHCDSGV